MCAKLHAVAATNSERSPDGITLLLLGRATYIWVLCFTHIPFVVSRAFSATPAEFELYVQTVGGLLYFHVIVSLTLLGKRL